MSRKIFSNCMFCLELDFTFRYKCKKLLRAKVTDNDGIISYIITRKVTHLLVSASKDSDPSYRVNTALKYGIPVVSIDFIDACVAQGKLLKTNAFAVFGASTEFSSGKVTTSGLQKACGEEQYLEYILNIAIYILLLYAVIMQPGQPLPDLWEEIDRPSASKFILEKLRDLQLYLRRRDDLHPFLYHRLELGWNLQEVAVNVLRRSLAINDRLIDG